MEAETVERIKKKKRKSQRFCSVLQSANHKTIFHSSSSSSTAADDTVLVELGWNWTELIELGWKLDWKNVEY